MRHGVVVTLTCAASSNVAVCLKTDADLLYLSDLTLTVLRLVFSIQVHILCDIYTFVV